MLYAPLIVADAATATGLQRQSEIVQVRTMSDTLDVAVLSVGAWQSSAPSVFDLLTPEEQDNASAAGVCGEVSVRFFGPDGQSRKTALDARVLGADLDQISTHRG